jgi:hypothetical protein
MNSLSQLKNIVFAIYIILLPLSGVNAISEYCSMGGDSCIMIIVFVVVFVGLLVIGIGYNVYRKATEKEDETKRAGITSTTRNMPIVIRNPPPTFSNRAIESIPIVVRSSANTITTTRFQQHPQRTERELLPPPSYPDSQSNNPGHIVLNIDGTAQQGPSNNNAGAIELLPPPYFENSRSTTNTSS